MRKFQRFKKQVHNYLFDHVILKYILEYSWALIICTVSALFFGFGFSTFARGVATEIDGVLVEHMDIVTGGASGISQSLKMILELFVTPDNDILKGVTIESILYFVVNVPLIIFAFRKIGVRFSILTLINVGLSSLFMNIFREDIPFIQEMAKDPLIMDQPLTRALFAGVCTGMSTALAFKGLFSTGGLDIISYYISMKKSTGAGKYSGMLNVVNITIYTALIMISMSIYPDSIKYTGKHMSTGLIGFLYGLVYLVVVMLVVDLINVRNKKVQVQIITNEEHLSDVLIANFPHSVTITNAKGGYSKQEKFILTMVVSSFELKKVVDVVKKTDPRAFVQALSLHNVYGKFYMTPIK